MIERPTNKNNSSYLSVFVYYICKKNDFFFFFLFFYSAVKYVDTNNEPTEYERMDERNEEVITASQSYQQLQDQEESSQAISVISNNTEVDV